MSARDALAYSGAVEARRARSTGTVVVLLDARNGGDWIDSEGERWITFCDAHSAFVTHETRSLARSFLSAPEQFCAECQEVAR